MKGDELTILLHRMNRTGAPRLGASVERSSHEAADLDMHQG
jgi:hypothetical protein